MLVWRRSILSDSTQVFRLVTPSADRSRCGPIAFLVAGPKRFVQSKKRLMIWYSNVSLDGKLKRSVFYDFLFPFSQQSVQHLFNFRK